MAVYTQIGAERLAELIACYPVGSLISAKGIAEGVSNSNWVIETTGPDGKGARYILTMYERRIDIRDLPFFLGLLDHLAAKGCPVPATIHDREGAAFRTLDGKAVALIEYLPGVSPDRPSTAQAHAVGATLAEMHRALDEFGPSRADRLTPEASLATLERHASRLAEIDDALDSLLPIARDIASQWPDDLPRAIIHSDLFPDNVLMLDDEVSGMIDFYFACDGFPAYDLAVTHAAWSFEPEGRQFRDRIGQRLIQGYRTVRPLSRAELTAFPVLAQGACLRFIASRVEDWFETPHAAQLRRKDPMDFMRRLEFYRENGKAAFP